MKSHFHGRHLQEAYVFPQVAFLFKKVCEQIVEHVQKAIHDFPQMCPFVHTELLLEKKNEYPQTLTLLSVLKIVSVDQQHNIIQGASVAVVSSWTAPAMSDRFCVKFHLVAFTINFNEQFPNSIGKA